MPRSTRTRLQIELSPRHEMLLRTLGERMDTSDAETARCLFDIVGNIADQIRSGRKLAFLSHDDEHPDGVPELTRALRPELSYLFLVQRPHAWRRQLSLKGRRLTVGQLLGRMRTEGWTPQDAAEEFDLPLEAVREAIDYGARYASLIAAEDAEEASAAKSVTDAASAR